MINFYVASFLRGRDPEEALRSRRPYLSSPLFSTVINASGPSTGEFPVRSISITYIFIGCVLVVPRGPVMISLTS